MLIGNLLAKTDPALNPKARVLKKIIWSVLAFLSVSFIANMFLIDGHHSRFILIMALAWSYSLLMLFLMKKGYVYFAAFCYVSFLIIMIFSFSWSGGGIKAHGMKVLPIVVLTAGLTLGKKEIWVFGILTALTGLAVAAADHYNYLPVKDPVGSSPFSYWIYISACFLLICALENLSVEELRKALKRSKKELLRREASEVLLKEKNKKLLEIAHLQSHMVRGPVASILGLVDLIKTDRPDHPDNLDLIPNIEIAAKDLDAVIQDIVRKTEEVEMISKHE